VAQINYNGEREKERERERERDRERERERRGCLQRLRVEHIEEVLHLY